jgi:hypothetical protein
MTDFDRNVPPVHKEPARVAVAPHGPMATNPLFSSHDLAAGIVAAVMILGPLAMAAFAVGRH